MLNNVHNFPKKINRFRYNGIMQQASKMVRLQFESQFTLPTFENTGGGIYVQSFSDNNDKLLYNSQIQLEILRGLNKQFDLNNACNVVQFSSRNYNSFIFIKYTG